MIITKSISRFARNTLDDHVKHWHGAAADSLFSHLAVEIDGEETSNEWCESVAEEDYLKIQ